MDLPAEPHSRAAAAARRGATRALAWVVLVALLHGLAWQLLLPAWQGEDEPWHFEVVEHVARGHWPSGGREFDAAAARRDSLALVEVLRRFPTLERGAAEALQSELALGMQRAQWVERVDFAPWIAAPTSYDGYVPGYSAATQPPLAYLVTGAWLRAWNPRGLEARLACARWLSLVWLAATCAGVFESTRRLCGSLELARTAGLCAALWPMLARQGAIVSNDSLASALGAAAAVCAAHALAGARPLRAYACLVVVIALALATKTTTAAWLAALVLVPLLRERADPSTSARASWVARVATCAVGACIATALAFAAWWSWSRVHSPVTPKSVASALSRLDAGTRADAWLDTWSTWLGRTCWNTRGWPRAFELALLGVPLVWLVGCVRAFVRQPALRRASSLCAMLVLAQVALVALRGVGIGRYLLPAIAPLATLAVCAALELVPERARERVLELCVGAHAAYTLAFVLGRVWSEQWLGLGA